MWRQCFAAFLIAFSGQTASAQQPDAILDRMAKTYHNARSFIIESEATITVRVRQGQQERTGRGGYRSREVYERPNKIRLSMSSTTSVPMAVGQVVCDGKQMYLENPNLKRTQRLNAAGVPLKNLYTNRNLRSTEAIIVGITPILMAAHGDWRPFAAEPKLVGREKVGNRETYRIRFRVLDTSMLVNEIERPIYEEVWIGVKDNLIWKAEVVYRIKQGNIEQIQTTTAVITRQELNKPIDPKEFEYRLPAGYRFASQKLPSGSNLAHGAQVHPLAVVYNARGHRQLSIHSYLSCYLSEIPRLRLGMTHFVNSACHSEPKARNLPRSQSGGTKFGL
ncbi:MAG: DUF2092 domain-containing protein [Fimbriimonadales bacterium]|nr:DUF2092 domain-containing protein [Fimbriimonadales bacterium]